MPDVVFMVPVGLLVLSGCYMLVACFGTLKFGRMMRSARTARDTVGITVLKPLCGPERELAENLRSFCQQDYENFQIIFGVRNSDDPAGSIATEIINEFPDRDIELVIDDTVIGTNLKISNLANMYGVAKHELIVIADSDMRVDPDYLKTVAASFENADVGAATCLYSGSADHGAASRLGAMFINDWFLPSALIPTMFSELSFCFGATMAVRRELLDEFGGFEKLANVLADDYMLGNLVHRGGRKVALVPYIVENVVSERNLKSLFLHELRWARTIRSVQPGGYALSVITEALPISLITAVFLYFYDAPAWQCLGVVALAFGLRVLLHSSVYVTVRNGRLFSPWLIPLRDLFSFGVRVSSYFGSTVHWRDQVMTIDGKSRFQDTA
ncbi:MAG: glycosyltransferase [Rhodospirillaceae bacterium]|nr:glycosyltransferase [Rhodospirillaceae bacterium]MBT6086895.1 glycosyltransferase [Rhodospirillaceae bacterium]MBT7248589.1 glycosyltransferase [Rhodospirillaceae bacterium]